MSDEVHAGSVEDTGQARAGRDGAAPAAPDQDLVLGRVEFRRGLNGVQRVVHDEAAGLRESIGWACMVLAAWLFFVGALMASQSIRGSR